jgi:hypothetical protein
MLFRYPPERFGGCGTASYLVDAAIILRRRKLEIFLGFKSFKSRLPGYSKK